MHLADLGIEGDYEGIGHCASGYAATELNAPASRKEKTITNISRYDTMLSAYCTICACKMRINVPKR